MTTRRVAALAALALAAAGCQGSHVDYARLDGATVRPDDRTIVVGGVHGACDTVLEPEVTETPTEVRIAVPLHVEEGPCTSVGLFLREQVTLREPLGPRQLVDARTGQPLSRDRT